MAAAFIAFPADAPAPAPAAQVGRSAPEAASAAVARASAVIQGAVTAAQDQAEQFLVQVVRDATASITGSSDLSGFDEITAQARPSFRGTGRPGAAITLYAQLDGEDEAVRIGRVVANRRDGSWTLRANRPLADGAYTVLGTQTDTRGQEGPREPRARILVDTAGPRVVGLAFDPESRTATLAVRDLGSGFAGDPATAIQVTRPGAATSTPLTVTVPGRFVGSTDVQVLTVAIQDDLRIPADGYRFDLIASRILDRAGNPLDGEFSRGLPSGDGRAGGDFRARLSPFRVRPLSTPG